MISNLSAINSPVTKTFLFNDFQGDAVNFASVAAVSFFVDGSTLAALDMSIDNFKTAVPEPTSLALLSLGLVAFGYTRRRVS